MALHSLYEEQCAMVIRKHKPNYPLQRKLFEELKRKYKKRSQDWVNCYMSGANLTKTPAYNRIAGLTPISFDEGIRLIQSEGIDLMGRYLYKGEFSSALDEKLLQDCQQINEICNPTIILSIQDLPLLYLKLNRFVAGFKLYCSYRFEATPSEKFPPFSKSWIQDKVVSSKLDQKRKTLDQLLLTPRTDIWTIGMFDSTINTIKYLESIHGFSSTMVKDEVVGGLFAIIERLKEIASDTSGRVKVYENGIFSIGNNLLFESDELKSLYIWSDLGSKLRIETPYLIKSYHQKLINMLPRATYINASAELNFHHFFHRLERRVKSML